MRFVDSRCIHCGATLRLAADATHVCCQYCNAELLVAHDGAQVTTQLVQKMQADLGQKLDVLRVQNELERLDREWHLDRERFMVSEKGGGKSVPTVAGSIFFGLVAAGFGIFWVVSASGAGAPGPFVLFGVVFVGIIIFAAINGVIKAGGHGTAETEYRAARRRLIAELKRVEQPGPVARK